MQLFRAQNTHDGLQAGTIYELDDQDVEYRSGAIEAGFLIEVGPGIDIERDYYAAGAEAVAEHEAAGNPITETPAPE